jgi:GH24 family phage-related lysozyme (muramidase)
MVKMDILKTFRAFRVFRGKNCITTSQRVVPAGGNMKVLVIMALLAVSITGSAFELWDVEPRQVTVPPQYQDIYMFLRRIETFHSTWYVRNGVRVIGYGDRDYNLSNPVNKNAITENMANWRLLRNIRIIDNYLDTVVEVPLNRHQKDALISYIYSTSIPEFTNGNILRLLNQKRAYGEVPNELRQAVFMPDSKSQNSWLVTRRSQEISMWCR